MNILRQQQRLGNVLKSRRWTLRGLMPIQYFSVDPIRDAYGKISVGQLSHRYVDPYIGFSQFNRTVHFHY